MRIDKQADIKPTSKVVVRKMKPASACAFGRPAPIFPCVRKGTVWSH